MQTQTVTESTTLIPSGYTGLTSMTASSSHPATDGYNDTSQSSSYAQFSLSTSTTGYVYYTFDVSDIPSDATISSVAAQARVRVSSTSRVTNTQCQLYTNTTAKGSNVTFASTSSSNIATLSTGTWTRSELNNLRMKIGGTGSSSSNTKAIYFYGATVTITYTYQQTVYDITLTNNTSATAALSSSTSPAGGEVTVTSDTLTGITVTDNGTNVTSQFVESHAGTEEYYPSGNTISGFTSSDISNAYHGADNDTYANCSLAGSTTGTLYLTFGSISVPTGATISSVSCSATLQFNANSSSSGFTSSCQMYSGTTAKGSATQWVTSGSNKAKTTYNLTVGSWTASELANARFYITATNSASRTVRYVYVYGVTLTVEYQLASTTYIYTISNIAADHVIVFSGGSPVASDKISFKNNGSWIEAVTVYKKVNGSWVQQTDLTSVFDPNTHYVKGG